MATQPTASASIGGSILDELNARLGSDEPTADFQAFAKDTRREVADILTELRNRPASRATRLDPAEVAVATGGGSGALAGDIAPSISMPRTGEERQQAVVQLAKARPVHVESDDEKAMDIAMDITDQAMSRPGIFAAAQRAASAPFRNPEAAFLWAGQTAGIIPTPLTKGIAFVTGWLADAHRIDRARVKDKMLREIRDTEAAGKPLSEVQSAFKKALAVEKFTPVTLGSVIGEAMRNIGPYAGSIAAANALYGDKLVQVFKIPAAIAKGTPLWTKVGMKAAEAGVRGTARALGRPLDIVALATELHAPKVKNIIGSPEVDKFAIEYQPGFNWLQSYLRAVGMNVAEQVSEETSWIFDDIFGPVWRKTGISQALIKSAAGKPFVKFLDRFGAAVLMNKYGPALKQFAKSVGRGSLGGEWFEEFLNAVPQALLQGDEKPTAVINPFTPEGMQFHLSTLAVMGLSQPIFGATGFAQSLVQNKGFQKWAERQGPIKLEVVESKALAPLEAAEEAVRTLRRDRATAVAREGLTEEGELLRQTEVMAIDSYLDQLSGILKTAADANTQGNKAALTAAELDAARVLGISLDYKGKPYNQWALEMKDEDGEIVRRDMFDTQTEAEEVKRWHQDINRRFLSSVDAAKTAVEESKAAEPATPSPAPEPTTAKPQPVAAEPAPKPKVVEPATPAPDAATGQPEVLGEETPEDLREAADAELGRREIEREAAEAAGREKSATPDVSTQGAPEKGADVPETGTGKTGGLRDAWDYYDAAVKSTANMPDERAVLQIESASREVARRWGQDAANKIDAYNMLKDVTAERRSDISRSKNPRQTLANAREMAAVLGKQSEFDASLPYITVERKTKPAPIQPSIPATGEATPPSPSEPSQTAGRTAVKKRKVDYNTGRMPDGLIVHVGEGVWVRPPTKRHKNDRLMKIKKLALDADGNVTSLVVQYGADVYEVSPAAVVLKSEAVKRQAAAVNALPKEQRPIARKNSQKFDRFIQDHYRQLGFEESPLDMANRGFAKQTSIALGEARAELRNRAFDALGLDISETWNIVARAAALDPIKELLSSGKPVRVEYVGMATTPEATREVTAAELTKGAWVKMGGEWREVVSADVEQGRVRLENGSTVIGQLSDENTLFAEDYRGPGEQPPATHQPAIVEAAKPQAPPDVDTPNEDEDDALPMAGNVYPNTVRLLRNLAQEVSDAENVAVERAIRAVEELGGEESEKVGAAAIVRELADSLRRSNRGNETRATRLLEDQHAPRVIEQLRRGDIDALTAIKIARAIAAARFPAEAELLRNADYANQDTRLDFDAMASYADGKIHVGILATPHDNQHEGVHSIVDVARARFRPVFKTAVADGKRLREAGDAMAVDVERELARLKWDTARMPDAVDFTRAYQVALMNSRGRAGEAMAVAASWMADKFNPRSIVVSALAEESVVYAAMDDVEGAKLVYELAGKGRAGAGDVRFAGNVPVNPRQVDLFQQFGGEPSERTEVSRPQPAAGENRPVAPLPTGGGGLAGRPGLRVVGAQRIPTPPSVVNAQPYARELDGHQSLAADLIVERFRAGGLGFLLGDGAGVGKTRIILAAADLMQKRTGKPSLIVTQNRQIIDGSFTADSRTMGLKLSDFEVGTYDDLRTGKIGKGDYGVAVYDESHNLKNDEAQKTVAQSRVKSDHVLFASATPLDRPTGAAYFISKTTGESEDKVLAKIGVVVIHREDPETRELRRYIEPAEGLNWQAVMENLANLRDQMIAEGSMLRAEYPFWGELTTETFSMTPDQVREDGDVDAYWQGLIDEAGSPNYRRNLSGQRTMEMRRLMESRKIDHTIQVIDRELADGRSIVVIGEGVNPTTIKGIMEGESQGKEVPGLIGAIAKHLQKNGIDFAKVYGTGDKSGEVDRFLTNNVRVMLATPRSGGAGINADDLTGKHPRSMVVTTLNFAGDVTDQTVYRVSRRNSKSPAKVMFLLSPESWADSKSVTILRKKLEALKRIQSDEEVDIDQAYGFDLTGEPIAREEPPLAPTKVAEGAVVSIDHYGKAIIIRGGEYIGNRARIKELNFNGIRPTFNWKLKGWILPARYEAQTREALKDLLGEDIRRMAGNVPSAVQPTKFYNVNPELGRFYVQPYDTPEAARAAITISRDVASQYGQRQAIVPGAERAVRLEFLDPEGRPVIRAVRGDEVQKMMDTAAIAWKPVSQLFDLRHQGRGPGEARPGDIFYDNEREQKQIRMFAGAWHGSGAGFDRFDLGKVGTGEGAQTFGWGLYFTDLKSIAKWYAEHTSGMIGPNAYTVRMPGGNVLTVERGHFLYRLAGMVNEVGPTQAALDFERWIRDDQALLVEGSPDPKRTQKAIDEYKASLVLVRQLKKDDVKPLRRHLYKVNLPDNANWLDWDKPVSDENARKILAQAEREGITISPATDPTLGHPPGSTVYHGLGVDIVRAKKIGESIGTRSYDQMASEFLHRAGIDGIRYPAGTLSGGKPSGAKNYVVFDENAVQIQEHRMFSAELAPLHPAGTVDFEQGKGALSPEVVGQVENWLKPLMDDYRVRTSIGYSPTSYSIYPYADAGSGTGESDAAVAKQMLKQAGYSEEDINESIRTRRPFTVQASAVIGFAPSGRPVAAYTFYLNSSRWDVVHEGVEALAKAGAVGTGGLDPHQFAVRVVADAQQRGIDEALRGLEWRAGPTWDGFGELARDFSAQLPGATQAEKEAEARRQYEAVVPVRDAQGRLLAPNGQPSKLNERQWRQVRTRFFLDWFGNWLTDSANASKVVDANGEPLVVKHATKSNFTEFRVAADFGAHFGTDKQTNDLNRPATMPVFLNIRNPLRLIDQKSWEADLVVGQLGTDGIDVLSLADEKALREQIVGLQGVDQLATVQRAVIDKGYDGVVYLNRVEGVLASALDAMDGDDIILSDDGQFLEAYNYAVEGEGEDPADWQPQDSYIAFSPTQIKSATANVGTFGPAEADIRFSATPRRSVRDMTDAELQAIINRGTANEPPMPAVIPPPGTELVLIKDGTRVRVKAINVPPPPTVPLDETVVLARAKRLAQRAGYGKVWEAVGPQNVFLARARKSLQATTTEPQLVVEPLGGRQVIYRPEPAQQTIQGLGIRHVQREVRPGEILVPLKAVDEMLRPLRANEQPTDPPGPLPDGAYEKVFVVDANGEVRLTGKWRTKLSNLDKTQRNALARHPEDVQQAFIDNPNANRVGSFSEKNEEGEWVQKDWFAYNLAKAQVEAAGRRRIFQVQSTAEGAIALRMITEKDYRMLTRAMKLTPGLRIAEGDSKGEPLTIGQAEKLTRQIEKLQTDEVVNLKDAIKTALSRATGLRPEYREKVEGVANAIDMMESSDEFIKRMKWIDAQDGATGSDLMPRWLFDKAKDALKKSRGLEVLNLPAEEIRGMTDYVNALVKASEMKSGLLAKRRPDGTPGPLQTVEEVTQEFKDKTIPALHSVDQVEREGAGWIRKVLVEGNADLMTLAEKLGGENSKFYNVFKALRQGEHRASELQGQALKPVTDATKGVDRKEIQSWLAVGRLPAGKFRKLFRDVIEARRAATKWVTVDGLEDTRVIDPLTGNEVTRLKNFQLSIDDLMWLKAMWERNYGHDELLRNNFWGIMGLKFPAVAENKEQAQWRNQAIRFSPADIQRLIAQLPPQAVKLVEAGREAMNILWPELEKALVDQRGFAPEHDVNYFPMHKYFGRTTDPAELVRRRQAMTSYLDNRSYVQPIEGGGHMLDASNGYMAELTRYIQFAADYAGKTAVVSDAMRVLNDEKFRFAVEEHVKRGGMILDQMDGLLRNFMFGPEVDPVTAEMQTWIMERFSVMALAGKIHTAVIQGASAMTAVVPAIERGMDAKYFSVVDGRKYWVDSDITNPDVIGRHSYQLGERLRGAGKMSHMMTPGGYMVDPVDIITDARESFYWKPMRWSDAVAVRHIIKSVEAFVYHYMGQRGEMLAKTTAQLAEEIVDESQAGGSALALPFIGLQSRKNPMLMGFTMFSSEMFRNLNMWMRAAMRYQRLPHKTVTEFARLMATAILTLLIPALVYYVNQRVWKAIYRGLRPPENKTAAAAHGVNVALNMLGNLGPVGNFSAMAVSKILSGLFPRSGVQDQSSEDVLTGLMGQAGDLFLSAGKVGLAYAQDGSKRTRDKRLKRAWSSFGYGLANVLGFATKLPLGGGAMMLREFLRADTRSAKMKEYTTLRGQATAAYKRFRAIASQQGEDAAWEWWDSDAVQEFRDRYEEATGKTLNPKVPDSEAEAEDAGLTEEERYLKTMPGSQD